MVNNRCGSRFRRHLPGPLGKRIPEIHDQNSIQRARLRRLDELLHFRFLINGLRSEFDIQSNGLSQFTDLVRKLAFLLFRLKLIPRPREPMVRLPGILHLALIHHFGWRVKKRDQDARSLFRSRRLVHCLFRHDSTRQNRRQQPSGSHCAASREELTTAKLIPGARTAHFDLLLPNTRSGPHSTATAVRKERMNSPPPQLRASSAFPRGTPRLLLFSLDRDRTPKRKREFPTRVEPRIQRREQISTDPSVLIRFLRFIRGSPLFRSASSDATGCDTQVFARYQQNVV